MAQIKADARGRPKGELLLSIQYIRAVAATSVVWWHITDQTVMRGCAVDKIIHVGNFGVDLFFVVSGFVMVLVTTNRETSPLNFMAMRAARIVPIYWLYTLGAAALLLVRPGLFSSNELTWRHLLLSLAFIPHALSKFPSQSSPLIKVGWTLNYEMFFYALFAIAMLISYRRRVAMTAGVIAALVLAGVLGFGAHSVQGKFFTYDIMLEFAFGMCIASLPPGFARGFGSWPTLAIVLVATAFMILSSYHEDWPRALAGGVPAAIVVWGVMALERRRPLPRNGILLEIGNASYSIYLFQLYPIAMFRALASHFGIASCHILPVTAFIAASLVSTLAGGVLSYQWIEKPILKLARQAAGSLRPRTT